MEKDPITGEEFSEKPEKERNLNTETTSEDETKIQHAVLDELTIQIGELKERMTELEEITLDNLEKRTIDGLTKISR